MMSADAESSRAIRSAMVLVGRWKRGISALLLIVLFLTLVSTGSTFVRAAPLPPGFHEVEGRYVDIITDLPPDDDLRQLAVVFDAAVPLWCEQFGMQLEEVADWHATAYIMLDRDRFQRSGYIPKELPNFPFGFQFQDGLWVMEQPSPYYRRHLLLHEGTHWFMMRKFGSAGPPWLMEGMAEWLATHRWDGQQLTMGIIPSDKQDVPYWGRITLIQQQLADGSAPSLEAILRYNDTAHQRVDAYAWSWAAVIFLKNHPETKRIFELIFSQPMRSDSSLTRWLFGRLRIRWPQLRMEWNAFLTDLEYGYVPAQGMLRIGKQVPPTIEATPVTFELNAQTGWQSAGVKIDSVRSITIAAKGKYSVGDTPGPWLCEPSGVTLEYYRGEPLGRLLMTSIAALPKEPEHSQPLAVVSVGEGGEFEVPAGELFFRINESMGGLSDNSGTLTVTIQP